MAENTGAYTVINLELRSIDNFTTVEEAEEHILYFLDEGYKLKDIRLYDARRLNISVKVS